jgi:lysozyme
MPINRNLSKPVVALLIAGASALSITAVFTPEKEGRSLSAYRDPIGVVTICDGDTHNVRLGQLATPKECDARTLVQLKAANAIVKRCVKVPLNPNQEAAFTDFAYNVGPGGRNIKDGFCTLRSGRTPSFLTKLNNYDYDAACQALESWIPTVTGPQAHIRDGLASRRYQEIAICKYPYAGPT